MDPIRFLRALDFAAEKHRDQRRKDAGASPYINHPIAVASVLAIEGHVTDEDLLLAALLHDTVEDTKTTFAELESHFGKAVSSLVREVTDDKALDRQERKRLQIEHAARSSARAKQLKLGDKIANIRDVTDGPPADWSVESRLDYLAWAEQVAAGCRGVNTALEAAFDAALVRGRRKVARAMPTAVAAPPASVGPSPFPQRHLFERYVGIDYSGAETPDASLPGLRVYTATRHDSPREEPPPTGLKKYWTRSGIATWLGMLLSEDVPVIVGIDHGFSFPVKYFERHKLPHDWTAFLEDFRRHWPTDRDHVYVDFIRDGADGAGALRAGNKRWRRLTEVRAGGAKSVFHFDVQGAVAKSTHAGLPWLRYLRTSVTPPPHFWPFDGWLIQPGRSVVVEAYPRLWKTLFPTEQRNVHQQDAFAVASWLREADADGRLAEALQGPADLEARKLASVEGWILGVK